MTISGLRAVAIRTGALDEAIERFTRIGLPLVDTCAHPTLDCPAAVLGVGRHRLVLVEDTGAADGDDVRTGTGPFAYLSMARSEDDSGVRHAGSSMRQGLFGAGEWLYLTVANAAVEVVDAEPQPEVIGDTGIWRIESIPWSVSDRAAACEEATRVLGFVRSDANSDLVFPDLHSTNSMMFVGDDCYIDFNEPTDPSSPTARRLTSHGNGIFALVLEPRGFDDAVAKLAERNVPTVTARPVDLRVVWRDGTHGSAARILSIDKQFTFGARIFISEPTFPW